MQQTCCWWRACTFWYNLRRKKLRKHVSNQNTRTKQAGYGPWVLATASKCPQPGHTQRWWHLCATQENRYACLMRTSTCMKSSISLIHRMTYLALGISGGVDSMALAELSRQLKTSDETWKDTEFHAMIVDHGLRPESSKEATKVAEIMDKFGTI